MKEHPIIFSTAMVQAILEGRKSKTRRVLKSKKLSVFTDSDLAFGFTTFTPAGHVSVRGIVPLKGTNGVTSGESFIKSPYGMKGDVLWVRESFQTIGDKPYYFADNPSYATGSYTFKKWKPSIHMPRSAARIFLKVENVRVERLQEISDEDVFNEGIPLSKNVPGYAITPNADFGAAIVAPKFAFQILWNEINGTRASWESNPWVWVIEFSRINNYL